MFSYDFIRCDRLPQIFSVSCLCCLRRICAFLSWLCKHFLVAMCFFRLFFLLFLAYCGAAALLPLVPMQIFLTFCAHRHSILLRSVLCEFRVCCGFLFRLSSFRLFCCCLCLFFVPFVYSSPVPSQLCQTD